MIAVGDCGHFDIELIEPGRNQAGEGNLNHDTADADGDRVLQRSRSRHDFVGGHVRLRAAKAGPEQQDHVAGLRGAGRRSREQVWLG